MRMDSISKLPDEIMGKILSLLPTKVAVSTSVLSKRWRHMVCLVDSLWFEEPIVPYQNVEEARSISLHFCNFVDKMMISLLSNSPMKKFSLYCTRLPAHDHDHDRIILCFNRWFQTAMERSLLEIQFHTSLFAILKLESLLLKNNTLVKLSLSHLYLREIKHVSFPALESLTLLSVVLDHVSYCQLLMGSPVLEIFNISDCYIKHTNQPCLPMYVNCDSIRRLVISSKFPDYKDPLEIVVFRTPSLVYFEYTSYVFQQYKVDYMDMLVEARLSLKLYDYHEPIFGDVTKLLAGITNITTLHLSPDSLEVIYFCCGSMPLFNNLLNLSIESNKEKGWQVMPLLLKNCPNLHTLGFKGLMHRVTNLCGDACVCIGEKVELCCLWTCKVKVLEITEFGNKELKQMCHFLGKLKCLETVKIKLAFDSNGNINNKFLRDKLLALPKVSSKCSIQFI